MDNTTAKGGVSPLASPDSRTASQVAMADAVEALIPPPARAKRGGIAEIDGEPVAFMMTLPDLNERVARQNAPLAALILR